MYYHHLCFYSSNNNYCNQYFYRQYVFHGICCCSNGYKHTVVHRETIIFSSSIQFFSFLCSIFRCSDMKQVQKVELLKGLALVSSLFILREKWVSLTMKAEKYMPEYLKIQCTSLHKHEHNVPSLNFIRLMGSTQSSLKRAEAFTCPKGSV